MGTKQTEAMKLALEALKQIDEAMPFPVAKLAQAALREALAEQAAQQEPVAWMYPDDYERMTTSETFCTVYSMEVGSATRGESTVALYTSTPAQRTWVGLKDEEYDEIWRQDLNNKGLMDLTIAKLKEKNT